MKKTALLSLLFVATLAGAAPDFGPLANNPQIIDATRFSAMREIILYSMANADRDEIVDNFLALLVGTWPKTGGVYSATHTVQLATRSLYLPAIIDTGRPFSFSSVLLYKGTRNAAKNGNIPESFEPWMLNSALLSAPLEIPAATKREELRARILYLENPFSLK